MQGATCSGALLRMLACVAWLQLVPAGVVKQKHTLAQQAKQHSRCMPVSVRCEGCALPSVWVSNRSSCSCVHDQSERRAARQPCWCACVCGRHGGR